MATPKPFCANPKNIKAFVLGCDPTGFDKQGKQIEFETVFGIGRDGRYFAGIEANLRMLNIKKEQIYVQNLITEYQEKESAKNKNWLAIAKTYIESRCAEFDQIDPSRTRPVFLTSELLYKALLCNSEKLHSPSGIYHLQTTIPIPAEDNKLLRPLIPLYRHPAYALKKHLDYIERVKAWLQMVKPVNPT
jgi:hypothetical protein